MSDFKAQETDVDGASVQSIVTPSRVKCLHKCVETIGYYGKFFRKDKAMKTWTLKREVFARGSQRLVEYKVVDENGKTVCARNNQRDAVVSALRIASETGRGAVQVVGETNAWVHRAAKGKL
jgi:hypothetical protein